MSGSQSRAIYQGFARAKGWAWPVLLPLILQLTDSAPILWPSQCSLMCQYWLARALGHIIR